MRSDQIIFEIYKGILGICSFALKFLTRNGFSPRTILRQLNIAERRHLFLALCDFESRNKQKIQINEKPNSLRLVALKMSRTLAFSGGNNFSNSVFLKGFVFV